LQGAKPASGDDAGVLYKQAASSHAIHGFSLLKSQWRRQEHKAIIRSTTIAHTKAQGAHAPVPPLNIQFNGQHLANDMPTDIGLAFQVVSYDSYDTPNQSNDA
jgi:hypothetical protein